jgi:hypothetical protein
MELIPILSTIILIATISTFILAVGAYLLYKIREGKVEKHTVKQPEKLKAEYIVPAEEQVKKVYIEDVLEPKTQKIQVEEKIKPAAPRVEVYKPRFEVTDSPELKSEPAKSVIKEVELPKEKYSKISSLSIDGSKDDFKPGEIKWR